MKKLLLATVVLAATCSVGHAKMSGDSAVDVSATVEGTVPAPVVTYTPRANPNWLKSGEVIGTLTIAGTQRTCFYSKDADANGSLRLKNGTGGEIGTTLGAGGTNYKVFSGKAEVLNTACFSQAIRSVDVVRGPVLNRPQEGTYRARLLAYTVQQ